MLKPILYSSVGLSLIFNVWINIAAFNHARDAAQTGELVTHTLNVLNALDSASNAIHGFQNHHGSSIEVKNSFARIRELVLVPQRRAEARQLSEFSDQDLYALENNGALKIISALRSSEQAVLAARQNVYLGANDRQIHRIILSGILDAILILFFALAFTYDKCRARRVERSLLASLEHVESLNELLKRNLLQKDMALRTTVHDLKHPLGSIRGFASLLEDEARNNETVLGMSQAIQRISNNTLALVAELLADNDAELEPKESIDVMECLIETCMFLEVSAAKKNQAIVISPTSKSFSVLGPARQLQDVFYNLIGNAIKFSPHDKSIWIEAKNENGSHSICIRDQGPGFQNEDFQKLFMMGAKLSAKPTDGEHSSGIGLCSAKQIVEKFNGSIEVNNNDGHGATVTLTFQS